MPPGLFEPPPLLGNRRFGGPVSLRNRNRARAKKRAGKQSGSRTTRQAPSSAAARPHNHSSFHQASWLMQYICRSIYPLSWCAVRDWARGEPEEMLRGKRRDAKKIYNVRKFNMRPAVRNICPPGRSRRATLARLWRQWLPPSPQRSIRSSEAPFFRKKELSGYGRKRERGQDEMENETEEN